MVVKHRMGQGNREDGATPCFKRILTLNHDWGQKATRTEKSPLAVWVKWSAARQPTVSGDTSGHTGEMHEARLALVG